VLFAGDLLFAGKFPYAADDTCDPEAWIATLKTWLGMDILHVIPGHGPVTDLGRGAHSIGILRVPQGKHPAGHQAGPGLS